MIEIIARTPPAAAASLNCSKSLSGPAAGLPGLTYGSDQSGTENRRNGLDDCCDPFFDFFAPGGVVAVVVVGAPPWFLQMRLVGGVQRIGVVDVGVVVVEPDGPAGTVRVGAAAAAGASTDTIAIPTTLVVIIASAKRRGVQGRLG
jgi:hypothetical protein